MDIAGPKQEIPPAREATDYDEELDVDQTAANRTAVVYVY
jgi:hypothetical protein